MTFSWTLSRYIGLNVLRTIAFSALGLAALIYLIDAVEMLRHHASKNTVDGLTILGLSLLKLPYLIERVFPFIFLCAVMWSFSRLARSQELVVARASGVSVWGFLTPALAVAFLCGLFMITLFNTLSTTTIARYSQLDATLLKGKGSLLALSSTGLWLRQSDEGNQSVVHALRASDSPATGLRLEEVMVLRFDERGRFESRVDAESAVLRPHHWQLKNAWVNRPEMGTGRFEESYKLETSLTPERIEENFASPRTLSFWELPRFIKTAEEAGFSATRHRLHWHKILSTPFFLCAMVLVAATFSLRQSRTGGMVKLVVAGCLTGFALFFVSDVASAFGQEGVVPPAFAAWIPTLVAGLMGATTLLHLEDG